MILKVPSRSSAAAAGLSGVQVTGDVRIIPGDIITAIEGKPVDSVSKLAARLDDFKVGQSIRLEVNRKGKNIEVPITLQAGE